MGPLRRRNELPAKETIMTKLWTIPSLFLATGLLVAAFSPAEPEKTSGADDEESIVSALPLSDECSSCAVDEIGSTCESALDACAGNEDCLDPQACFGACEPDDASCFASCAAASALFDALVECVVCDACADACQGEWTCGGGGDDDDGSECENDQDCNDGGDEDPACQPGDDDCGDDGQPGDDGTEEPCDENQEGCDGTEDPDCEEGDPNCDPQDPGECHEGDPDCDPDGGEDPEPCEDGQDNCDPGDPDEGGEGSVCLECVHQQAGGECGDLVEACLNDETCNWVVECVHDCGDDVDCGAQCGQEGQNSDLVHQVLDCVLCGPCQEQCASDALCG
jgi:hypothetical protein